MMQQADFISDGPATARLTIVLAHGAGAPMDSPFMNKIATGLADGGWRVSRFEFPYMRARRTSGKGGRRIGSRFFCRRGAT